MKKIDVIVLSWDRLEDTIEAIQSALDQQNVDVHVIVVDQGSKLENISRIQEFCEGDPRITLICNSQNVGVPEGRNQASFAGQNKYIVALDNDAVFASNDELRKTADIMDNDANIGILAYRIKCFDKDTDDLSSWPYSVNSTEAERTSTFDTNRFVGAGYCVRRDVFEKLKGYDARLFFMHEEVDLAIRVINSGFKVTYNPSVAVRHKVSPEHRVSWSGKRFYYDVRNRTYLHFKHKTFFPTLVFHTCLLMIKGIKMGYAIPAFKGLFASVLLLPAAISEWFKDPYVTKTEASKAYFKKCDPLSNRTLWQRITYRLKGV